MGASRLLKLGLLNRSILSRAVALWRASAYSGSGALLDLTGRGHDLTLGGTSGADSNDPQFLPFTGTPYVSLPGTSGNYASSPDANVLDITDNLDIRVLVDRGSVWASGSETYIDNASGAAGYRLSHLDGVIRFGTATWGVNSSAHGITTGVWWLRVTMVGTLVSFFKSADGTAWTAIGTATAGGSLSASASALAIGALTGGASGNYSGAMYRAQVLNGATTVLDCDFTDLTKYAAGLGSLTENSANAATVTLNRSSTGRKLAVVDRPLFLLGTDDYLETADADDLDFGAGESFTVLCAFRSYDLNQANGVLVSKKSSGALGAGWWLRSTSNIVQGVIDDGAVQRATATPSTSGTAGRAQVAGLVRSVAADAITGFLDGVAGTAISDTTTATLANSVTLRVGASGAGAYFDGEFIGAALFRSALTDAEIARAGQELLAA